MAEESEAPKVEIEITPQAGELPASEAVAADIAVQKAEASAEALHLAANLAIEELTRQHEDKIRTMTEESEWQRSKLSALEGKMTEMETLLNEWQTLNREEMRTWIQELLATSQQNPLSQATPAPQEPTITPELPLSPGVAENPATVPAKRQRRLI